MTTHPLERQHLPILDGIRGLAILLVIPHNVNLMASPTATLPALLDLFSQTGWIGVQLFFVLSGFLITGNLLNMKGASNFYRAFWGRRILRIFPLYYATLIVAFIILPQFFAMNEALHGTMHNQPWLWLFVSNWTAPYGGEIYSFTHFWSLAVEEQFYFLWPVIVRSLSSRALLRLCGALTLGALGLRTILLWFHSDAMTVYMFTFCRMDALALGSAAALLYQDARTHAWFAHRSTLLSWLSIGALGAVFLVTHGFERDYFITQTLGQSSIAIAFSVLVLANACLPSDTRSIFSRTIGNALFRSIGKYSFAMYIFHFPLHMLITRPWFESHGYQKIDGQYLNVIYTVALIAISYILAYMSFHLFEKHFLKLKGYFSPRLAHTTSTHSL